MTKLTNCPFCGGESYIVDDFSSRRAIAKCSSCNANISVSYGDRSRRVPMTENDYTGKIRKFDDAKAKAISLWENRPYTIVTEDKNKFGKSEFTVINDPYQSRESAIINSIAKQGEVTNANVMELLLYTLRGTSVTVGMIYDILKGEVK